MLQQHEFYSCGQPHATKLCINVIAVVSPLIQPPVLIGPSVCHLGGLVEKDRIKQLEHSSTISCSVGRDHS